MKFPTRRLLLTSVSVAAFMGFGTAMAQDAERAAMVRPIEMGKCPCSHPVNISIRKGPSGSATNGTKSDAPPTWRMNQAVYDEKGVDKHFGDTISWKLPTNTCETTTTVSWTVKNNANNSLQNNDSTGLWLNGAALVSHAIGKLPLGQSKTYSYTMTPTQAKNMRVTLLAQDDTAVTDFRVTVVGCCINPN